MAPRSLPPRPRLDRTGAGVSGAYEEQRLQRDQDREEQLSRSAPYVEGRFVPGGFSVGQRDTYHFDVYARRRPGYVQWFYEKNPTSVAYPMADGQQERAFAIRGEPGKICVRDERWDRASEMRDRKPLTFPSVESAMAWIVATLLIEVSA